MRCAVFQAVRDEIERIDRGTLEINMSFVTHQEIQKEIFTPRLPLHGAEDPPQK